MATSTIRIITNRPEISFEILKTLSVISALKLAKDIAVVSKVRSVTKYHQNNG